MWLRPESTTSKISALCRWYGQLCRLIVRSLASAGAQLLCHDFSSFQSVARGLARTNPARIYLVPEVTGAPAWRKPPK